MALLDNPTRTTFVNFTGKLSDNRTLSEKITNFHVEVSGTQGLWPKSFTYALQDTDRHLSTRNFPTPGESEPAGEDVAPAAGEPPFTALCHDGNDTEHSAIRGYPPHAPGALLRGQGR